MTTIDISLKAVEQLARLDENGGTCDTQFIGYAATLRALSTALTQSRADTAAAYEVAAKAAMGHCYAIMSATDSDARAALIAVSIRALATPDQSSAIAAIETAAEARGMRKAVELALQRKGDGTATLDHPYDKGYLAACDACAAAILALIGEKK